MARASRSRQLRAAGRGWGSNSLRVSCFFLPLLLCKEEEDIWERAAVGVERDWGYNEDGKDIYLYSFDETEERKMVSSRLSGKTDSNSAAGKSDCAQTKNSGT